ncbi:hypothetical protein GJ496_002822 [Pomphorhynchus laevis]|nr:hypothetical protein GJ496_002822 [Pomphorhynchus laevis]
MEPIISPSNASEDVLQCSKNVSENLDKSSRVSDQQSGLDVVSCSNDPMSKPQSTNWNDLNDDDSDSHDKAPVKTVNSGNRRPRRHMSNDFEMVSEDGGAEQKYPLSCDEQTHNYDYVDLSPNRQNTRDDGLSDRISRMKIEDGKNRTAEHHIKTTRNSTKYGSFTQKSQRNKLTTDRFESDSGEILNLGIDSKCWSHDKFEKFAKDEETENAATVNRKYEKRLYSDKSDEVQRRPQNPRDYPHSTSGGRRLQRMKGSMIDDRNMYDYHSSSSYRGVGHENGQLPSQSSKYSRSRPRHGNNFGSHRYYNDQEQHYLPADTTYRQQPSYNRKYNTDYNTRQQRYHEDEYYQPNRRNNSRRGFNNLRYSDNASNGNRRFYAQQPSREESYYNDEHSYIHYPSANREQMLGIRQQQSFQKQRHQPAYSNNRSKRSFSDKSDDSIDHHYYGGGGNSVGGYVAHPSNQISISRESPSGDYQYQSSAAGAYQQRKKVIFNRGGGGGCIDENNNEGGVQARHDLRYSSKRNRNTAVRVAPSPSQARGESMPRHDYVSSENIPRLSGSKLPAIQNVHNKKQSQHDDAVSTKQRSDSNNLQRSSSVIANEQSSNAPLTSLKTTNNMHTEESTAMSSSSINPSTHPVSTSLANSDSINKIVIGTAHFLKSDSQQQIRPDSNPPSQLQANRSSTNLSPYTNSFYLNKNNSHSQSAPMHTQNHSAQLAVPANQLSLNAVPTPLFNNPNAAAALAGNTITPGAQFICYTPHNNTLTPTILSAAHISPADLLQIQQQYLAAQAFQLSAASGVAAIGGNNQAASGDPQSYMNHPAAMAAAVALSNQIGQQQHRNVYSVPVNPVSYAVAPPQYSNEYFGQLPAQDYAYALALNAQFNQQRTQQQQQFHSISAYPIQMDPNDIQMHQQHQRQQLQENAIINQAASLDRQPQHFQNLGESSHQRQDHHQQQPFNQ